MVGRRESAVKVDESHAGAHSSVYHRLGGSQPGTLTLCVSVAPKRREQQLGCHACVFASVPECRGRQPGTLTETFASHPTRQTPACRPPTASFLNTNPPR